MSTFDRYMLSRLTVTFGFFALILVTVYWINRAITLFDRLISDGQTAWVFLQFTALTLPNLILLVLPVAAFVATLYVTNRLASDSEMVVLQSVGMSAFRLIRPAVYFGLFVTLVMAILAHVLVPLSRTVLAERQAEVARDVTAQFLTAGQFLHPAEGVTLYIRDISELGELLNVLLSDRSDAAAQTLYLADRALIVRTEDGPRLVMFDGQAQTLNTADRSLSTVSFADFSYDLGSLVGTADSGNVSLQSLSTGRLLRASAADMAATGEGRGAFRAEAHARLAQPLQGLVMSVIGVAALMLGRFSRFGVGPQILLAVVLVILVQMLSNLAMDMSLANEALWPLLYAPAALGGIIALAMLWIASSPPLFRRRRAEGAA